MNTLKQIRDAKKILEDQLNQEKFAAKEKKLIQQAIFLLDDQEDIIINNSLSAMVGLLNSKNVELLALIDTMNKASGKISKISETVKKIADVVGVLTEITGKAISVGIL